MTQIHDRTRDLASVEAPLTYLVNADVMPVTYATAAGADRIESEGNYADHNCTIRDARPIAGNLTLDREGFALVPHATKVKDFYDLDETDRIYIPELEELVKAHSGASKVVVFDFTRRADSQDIQDTKMVRGPAGRVHNDYTDVSAPQRVRDLMPAGEAEALLERRYAIINVWRPVLGPVETSPLAVCDARSIAADDLVTTERRAKNRVGQVQHALYNPDHRWYYFPLQTRDEATLIKCFDSARDGPARFTAHCAFDDPTTPPGATPRESIEARTFAFF
ncbi:MAG: CmcJ/NvfI family oxidoreductase [Alphaproteobacteria bacterium]